MVARNTQRAFRLAASIFSAAGFQLLSVTPTATPLCLIEVMIDCE